jgi:transposase-like protein
MSSPYSDDFKKNAVETLLRPNSGGLRATSRKFNIPDSTLFGWKKKYAINDSMKKTKNDWSPEQKLEALIKTASMNQEELGKYLRSNGLHSSDLENFKKSYIEGVSAKGRPTLDPEIVALRKKNKALDKNLKRNQKALAEQSARIILLKKSHEIWGTPEEDE